MVAVIGRMVSAAFIGAAPTEFQEVDCGKSTICGLIFLTSGSWWPEEIFAWTRRKRYWVLPVQAVDIVYRGNITQCCTLFGTGNKELYYGIVFLPG